MAVIYENLAFLKKLPIYNEYVSSKIGVYSLRESYDKIRHYEDWESNEYNLNAEFDEHTMEDSVFGKYTSGTMLTIGDEMIYRSTESCTLESEVSRPTSKYKHIISRVAEDKAYKSAEDHKLLTTVKVKYSSVYDKNSELTRPMAIIKEMYKSDADDPEHPVKKSTNLITFDRQQESPFLFVGTESILLDSTNMLSEYLMAVATYAYTTENELMRLGLKFKNATPEFDEYVLPKVTVEDDKVIVTYARRKTPTEIMSKETFTIVDDSLRIAKIEMDSMIISFTYNEDGGDYDYHATSVIDKDTIYDFFGHINIPTSGEYICARKSDTGEAKMSYMSYFDSVFSTDPTGQYYYVRNAVDEVQLNGKTLFEYEYDGRYGVCTSMRDAGGNQFARTAETTVDDITYKEALLYADVLKNPPDRMKLYYRVVGIDKHGHMVKDYRAVMVKKRD